MQILTRTKQVIKSGVIGGSALVLLISPAAFAHGTSDSHTQSHPQTASSQQDKPGSNNWDWKHKQKLTCDQRQQILNQQAATTQAKLQKQLTGLNIVFSGIQTYVASGAVTVPNYDTLNGQATADQTSATNAVNAVAAPTLNCDDPSSWKGAQNDFNNSLKTANQALWTYRHDVMKLFQAALSS